MDGIISEERAQAIVKIAEDQLHFFQDNSVWAPSLLEIFIGDPDYYRPGPEAVSKEKLYFIYEDRAQRAKLMLIRSDDSSGVEQARFFAEEGSPLSELELSEANAALGALFTG